VRMRQTRMRRLSQESHPGFKRQISPTSRLLKKGLAAERWS
jgi:hypothetical protein